MRYISAKRDTDFSFSMNSSGLISYFVHCVTENPITLNSDELGSNDSRLPPIVDILVIEEENISLIPKEYLIVLNQSEDADPMGSIELKDGKRGYVCVKRSFGHRAICSLQLFPKTQIKRASSEGYFIVKQFPDGTVVDFGNELVLGYSHCFCRM